MEVSEVIVGPDSTSLGPLIQWPVSDCFRYASTGMPMGATSTRPASGFERPASPSLGRWKVTVTSARTTGFGGFHLSIEGQYTKVDDGSDE